MLQDVFEANPEQPSLSNDEKTDVRLARHTTHCGLLFMVEMGWFLIRVAVERS